MGQGGPLMNYTTAENGVLPKTAKMLGIITALPPSSSGLDVVPHISEHAPMIHSVEGI